MPSEEQTRVIVNRRCACAIAGVLVLAIGAAPTSAKENIPIKHAHFLERAGWIELSVGFRDMADSTLYQRLQSGFATTVLMRLYLYRVGRRKALAIVTRSVRVLYDLWEGHFVLQVDEPARPTRTLQLTEQSKAVDLLTSTWRFPLIRSEQIDVESTYYVAGLIEVNPISRDVLREVRRWLRKPQSRQRGGVGDNFFGSFVSIFVNDKIRRAEKAYRFRTQPFVLPR